MSADTQQSVSRSNKFWKIAGLIILIFAVIAVLLFGGFFVYYTWQVKYGDSAKLAERFAQEKFTRAAELSAVPERPVVENWQTYTREFNPVFGNALATLTLLVFADFECPYSREAYQVFSHLRSKYAPVLKVVFKHLPLQSIHPQALTAASAAACAAEQNRFWEYHDWLFAAQELQTDALLAAARDLNLNPAQFDSCLAQNKYASQINADMADAVAMGARGTPTYFLNGLRLEGVMTEAEWDKIILQFLNQ